MEQSAVKTESQTVADQDTEPSAPILAEQRNCCCIEHANRVTTLVEAADYFAAFARVCSAAKRQILILGWDFDRRERLHRDDEERDLPDELGAFLVALVKRNPDLHIYLLSWDFNMIYATERELLPALRLRMQAPPRFHFRLDGVHPKGASHHQKLVVVDDRVAFVGGIDLSRWRWDTSDHEPGDPRRTDPNGKPYPPFHDMMLMVEGDVARRLGDLARQRWRRARGWRIKPPQEQGESPWPDGIEAGLTDVDVAIARTEPAFRGRDEVREIEHLYVDAIRAARRVIYIENQYLTAHAIGSALAEKLREEAGPEVVLVLPQKTGGWLEQVTMDVVRGRLLQTLVEADEHDRLRVYFPFRDGLGDDCISVHAKLLIVDEQLLRIGSSNASNRSMGLDTECDLAIEANGQEQVSGYIRRLRTELLAQHLDCDPAALEQAEQEHGSLVEAIEQLRGGDRSLRELDWEVPENIDDLVPDSALVDPSEPFSPDYFVAEYVPRAGKVRSRRRLWMFLGLVAALLALAAAWRWTPLQDLLSPQRIGDYLAAIRSDEFRALAAVGGFVIASLAMVPVTLLAVIAGVVFTGWQAFAFVMAGAMLAAAIGFFAGRLMGRAVIERLDGSRFEQLSRRLAERGTIAVAVLRLVPVAPFAIFNLVAGSSHLGTRQFLVGSLLGLLPGLGAITLFSGSLWQALAQPSALNVALAVGIGVVLLAVAWFARRWLRSS